MQNLKQLFMEIRNFTFNDKRANLKQQCHLYQNCGQLS